MKSLKEIEDISLDALERIGDDKSVELPDALADSVIRATELSEFLDEKKKRPFVRMVAFAAPFAAAAAAVTLLFHLPSPTLEDTYDDPALAYAEIERTFSYISAKMNSGISIAAEAEADISSRTNQMIEKII